MTRILCWVFGHSWGQWSYPVVNIPGYIEGGDGFPGKRACIRPGCDAAETEE